MLDDNDFKIGLPTIWAIGVGSAVGGDFFGWQFVLYGGFGSALIGVIICGFFYWLYAAAITELAARYQSTGGSFDFVNRAFGRKTAALMGVLGLLKLILANSAVALAISSYMIKGGLPASMQSLCWVAMYGIFTCLDCLGIRQSANIQIAATLLCVFILLFYSGSSLSKFSISNLRQEGFFVDGGIGFMKGFPFALQFFDGFEEIPLLIGYSKNPEVTIPKAMLTCYITISVLALLILVGGSGVTPITTLLTSEAPLMDGINIVYGAGNALTDFIAYIIVIGLVVNFFSFIVFISQQVQAIAEGGQLPAFLAYRHPVHGAPIYASIYASSLGVTLTAGFAVIFGQDTAQNIMVTAALMPAVLGYIVLLECIVKIRKIEAVSARSKVSSRDYNCLGYDPGPLRFSGGVVGSRIAQAVCIFQVIALCILAGSGRDFLYGLIILAIFGIVVYAVMYYFIIYYTKSGGTHLPLPTEDYADDGTDDGSSSAMINHSHSHRPEYHVVTSYQHDDEDNSMQQLYQANTSVSSHVQTLPLSKNKSYATAL